MKKIFLMFMMSLLLVSSSFALETKLTPKEAKEIAKEAYVYGWTLILVAIQLVGCAAIDPSTINRGIR